MLFKLIASSSEGGAILRFIEFASLAIEVLAVGIIVATIASATARYFYPVAVPPPVIDRYQKYKTSLGRGLLLGLEILVAANVVRTVALEATLQSVVVLGLLVLIRTFLSRSLVVEIEGRWPWRPKPDQGQDD